MFAPGVDERTTEPQDECDRVGKLEEHAHGGVTVKSSRVREREARKAKARKTGKPHKIRLGAAEPAPAIDLDTFTELSDRVFNLEKVIVRMLGDERDSGKTKQRARKRSARRAELRAKLKARRVRVLPKVPTPTPDENCFPY